MGMPWFVNRTGVLYGLDLDSGERRVNRRLSASMWATPVGIGEALIVPTKDGVLDIVSADLDAEDLNSFSVLPEPKEPPAEAEGRGGRGGGQFGGATLYGIAVAGGRLYARDGDAVYCVVPRE